MGVGVDSFLIEPHWLEVVHRDLPIENLPSQWGGRTLMQISDIHVGFQVSDDYLLRSFERVAEYEPDVVVMTGDFVTTDRNDVLPREQVERIYSQFPKGRIATLGAYGNHDYGRTWRDVEIADELAGMLSRTPIRLLRNEFAEIEGLQILGLEDYWSRRCHCEMAAENLTESTARLVLCHNPDTVDHHLFQGYRGWILSGHTHGGQCKPPFLPPPILPVRNRRYTAGEFDLYDGRWLYINRGLGLSKIPARFNVRPEVTLFRLTAGDKAMFRPQPSTPPEVARRESQRVFRAG